MSLIAQAAQEDEIGNTHVMETAREVWAEVKSISRAEFSAAGSSGLKPSAMVRVHASDYQGERFLDLFGVRYELYREYRKGEDVELYVMRRGGDKHGHSS